MVVAESIPVFAKAPSCDDGHFVSLTRRVPLHVDDVVGIEEVCHGDIIEEDWRSVPPMVQGDPGKEPAALSLVRTRLLRRLSPALLFTNAVAGQSAPCEERFAAAQFAMTHRRSIRQ